MGEISTKQIGDGKLPNKYWVSISEDYYYESEPGVMSWISELGIPKSPKAKTIKVFNSYPAAKRFVDENLPLGIEYDDMVVNTVFVEDRISGTVFWRGREFDPRSGRLWEAQHEDLEFTNEVLAKHKARGHRVSRKRRTGRASAQTAISEVRHGR